MCIRDRVLSPAMRHLLHMQGEPWKVMRQKLTPAFTSGKMKMMFYLIEACSNELTKALEPIAEKDGRIVVKDFIARFTTDVIATCAFGLQSNSIQNPNDEFRENGKKIFETVSTLQLLKQRIAFSFPWVIKKLHLMKPFSIVPQDFFLKIISETVAYREKNGVIRNDFIDLLIKIKNNKNLYEEDKNGTTKDQNGTANPEAGE